MKRRVVILTLLISQILFSHTGIKPILASPPPPSDDNSVGETQVEESIMNAIHLEKENILPYLIFETQINQVELSEDQTWATALLVPVDPRTELVVPSEPGLAISYKVNGHWITILPSDPDWATSLLSIPNTLLSQKEKTIWLAMYTQQEETLTTETFGGYLLPWEAGKGTVLTRSITHYSPPNPNGSMHFAFDFASWHDATGTSPMFAIYSSKSGTVKYANWTQPNGSEDPPGNYLVLEDTTSAPTTYQLYLHLAQDSIPPELRRIGTPVIQGQYIGMADDTGYSTGNHLHFQVHTNPYSYWGSSVDITFNDVAINGGRPRTPNEASNYPEYGGVGQWEYISGNNVYGDIIPPEGEILIPETGVDLNTDTITLSGIANDDDSGLDQATFIALYNNEWQAIGPTFNTSPFTYQWNLCDDQVPDGPVSVALDIRDNAGNWAVNLPGLRHFSKIFTCHTPSPACIPDDNQVALFTDPNYAGTCELFNPGNYLSLDVLGNDTVNSILIGQNVRATLYMNDDLSGRGETFFPNDNYLDDNRIGSDTVSSIMVQPRNDPLPSPNLVSPDNNASYPMNSSLSLLWEDGGGAMEYLLDFDSSIKDWQDSQVFHLDSLAPGAYIWKAKARNSYYESEWSNSQVLNIQATPPDQGSTFTAPFTDTMENGYNGWHNSNNWDQALDEDQYHTGEVIWRYELDQSANGYDNGQPNTGDLTSPAIVIPDDGNEYYLRFWYLYETEGPGVHWDQRWVQLSIDGSPFTNLIQLSDDPPNYWLQSPTITLSEYSGSTIQVRFHFETLDAAFNTFNGWYIDDFSINSAPPPTCPDTGEPDHSLLLAQTINYNNRLSAEICPGGDVDYYQFDGTAGDQIGITTIAQSYGSTLDTYIYLLDDDGSILAENDDIILYELRDSSISFRLPYSGRYYIKVRAWNHPSVGSDDHTYSIHLAEDNGRPIAEFIAPSNNTPLIFGNTPISVSATDSGYGISHVDFFWHSSDWRNGTWTFIGSDWEEFDGWMIDFDTSSLPDQQEIAFFAQVHDWGGNSTGVGIWRLWLDNTPPVTSILPLAEIQSSTAFLVQWEGSDNLSGIDHFDLQVQTNGGTWENWLEEVDSVTVQAWFVGEMDHTYNFRLRGVDRVGNHESYPTSLEATTMIPYNTCSEGDVYENDNEPGSANQISESNSIQVHNFCNPDDGTAWLNDEDWYRIDINAGHRLFIQTNPMEAGVVAVLKLYAADSSTLLQEDIPAEFGDVSYLTWVSDTDTTLYLKITHKDGRVAGDEVSYSISLVKGLPIYLPVITSKH